MILNNYNEIDKKNKQQLIKNPVNFKIIKNTALQKPHIDVFKEEDIELSLIMKRIENERNSKNYGIFYIYVIENDSGNIKIGITHNFDKRKKSLDGSNNGGHKFTRYYVSPPTYLFTLEGILHNKFMVNRIPGTEWFKNLDYENVISEVEKLFNQSNYEKINNIRKERNIIHYREILKKELIQEKAYIEGIAR